MTIRRWACVLACLSAGSAAASGLYCANVEVPIDSGTTLRVECEGALYLDRLSVLRADDLIELRSTGDMTLWGTLAAPAIVLVSNMTISLGGGLFSGSPEAFPDVHAASWANTAWERVRGFGDLVPRPFIDPVFGAVTVERDEVLPLVESTPVTVGEFVFIPDETASPAPEPATLALFAAGLGLVAWVRCVPARLSRTAHSCRNRNVTFEN